MNIFPLYSFPFGEGIHSIDWKKSAQAHDDLRVSKMTLETTQLLCSSLNVLAKEKRGIEQLTPYKTCHVNHPCTKWARETSMNWVLLHRFGMYLSEEYTARYNRRHACQDKLDLLVKLYDRSLFDREDYTMLPLCMPEKYKSDDIVESYREFWVSKPNMRYVKRRPPHWFLEKRKTPFIGE